MLPRIEEIIETKPELPLYCFSPERLTKQANIFIRHFAGTVGYAVKSNPEPRVIKTLVDAGITTYDVASLNEIRLIREICPSARLLFDNPVKSENEIKEAYELYDVRVMAIDDPCELQKIVDTIGIQPDLELVVRFKIGNSNAVYDLSKKFGTSHDAAVALLKQCSGLGFKTSLTFHPGSQCSTPSSYGDYIKAAKAVVDDAQVKIETLNVGGGFPAPYLESDIPALAEYFAEIKTQWEALFASSGTELVCEPGRGMVDACVSLVTRVKHIRPDADVLFLNDGVYGAFMEQLFSPMILPSKEFRVNGDTATQLTSDKKAFTVFGPTCDSADILPYQPQLANDLAMGDYIVFGLMGGYGSATATKFNGFLPGEYVDVSNTLEELDALRFVEMA